MTSSIFKIETVDHLNFVAHGLIAASLLNASIRIGLFDALRDAAKSTEELGEQLNLDRRATLALVSPLASLGLLEGDGTLWKNSAVSEKYLVKGTPSYMGTYFARTMYEGQYGQMGKLMDVLEGEQPLQRGILTYGEDWRANARTMLPGQHEGSLATASYLMKKKILDLSKASAFLDLGCGSGAYSIAACQAHLKLRACCVDFEEILEITKEYIEANELSDRITTQALSYLDDPLPKGYDAVWFGGTLNGYSAEQIKTIFEKVHAVLPAGGILALYEYFIFDDRTGPLFSTLMNLNSFVGSNDAQILTLGEMQKLLLDTGFKDVRHQPLIREMTWLFFAHK